MTTGARVPCPWCGSMRGIVRVHGHGQCLTCNTNIEPCCSGDNGNDASTCARIDVPANVTPELFGLCFDALGGRDVTTTTESLLHVLGNRLGGTRDDATLVLEAANRIGIVRSAGPGLHRLR